MKKDIKIVAEPRAERGKNEARRLRVAGRIPAVVYGSGKEATAVAVDPVEINRVMFSSSGHNTIFSVEIAGHDTTPAMIVDWQHDPVKETLLHVDLERIDLTKKLTVRVPIHLEGEPDGVKKQGGLLEVVAREAELECFPGDIPEALVVDVRPLMIGDSVRVGDIELAEGVELKSVPQTVVCACVAMRAAEEEETAEEEEGLEGAEGAEGEEKPAEEPKEKE